MRPEQGERGLWYVGTVGFATKDQAQAYIDRGMKHYSTPNTISKSGSKGLLGYPVSQWVLGLVLASLVISAALWFQADPGQQTHRVGREFASMAQCLKFIANDVGDQLNVISDKPGDVSGKTSTHGLFFRCEASATGTRGLVLDGRWDRLK